MEIILFHQKNQHPTKHIADKFRIWYRPRRGEGMEVKDGGEGGGIMREGREMEGEGKAGGGGEKGGR